MLTRDGVQKIFGNSIEFPKVNNPIAYNSDDEKVVSYLTKLANDKEFLKEEAEAIGKEVEEMLKLLEEEGVYNEPK